VREVAVAVKGNDGVAHLAPVRRDAHGLPRAFDVGNVPVNVLGLDDNGGLRAVLTNS
jgi:hypothetical protein